MKNGDGKRADVLVIGGGWTGTQAALALDAAGVNVTLLEAGPKLGGRAKSFGYSPGGAGAQRFYFEHGAQYVGDSQTEIMALIRKYLPEALVDGYDARLPYRDQVAVLDGVRFEYNRNNCLFGIGGVPPTLDLWSTLGALLSILEIEVIELQIDVVSPWNSPADITPLDSITMADWLGRSWIPPLSAALLAMSVQALLSVETHELSAFYFHWYCACNGGFLNEVNDEEGGPQQYYLSTGMDALIDRTVEPIRDRIHLNCPVQSIRQADECGKPLVDEKGKPYVRVTLQDGRVWEAEKVLVAMSPKTYGRLSYSPPLPAKRQELAAQPMGRTLKCVVFYKSPWWRDSHGLRYTGYAGAQGVPVLWVMDYTPVIPEGQTTCYALMTFTVGHYVDELGPNPSKEKIVNLVTKGITFLFDDPRALSTSDEYIDLVAYSWDPAQTFVGGGPNSVMGTGLLTGPDCAGRLLNEPWDNVYFASSETSRKVTLTPKKDTPTPGQGTPGYSDERQSLGYMDGGIVAGRYVADQILASLGKAAPIAEPAASAPRPAIRGKDLPVEPARLSIEQVKQVLSIFCTQFYNGSALNFPQWEKDRWHQDSQALLFWVADQLMTALIGAGLLPPPPSDPPPVSWILQFMEVASSFVGSGYAYNAAASQGSDPGLEDISQMTSIGNALMQLKSAEPYTAPSGVPSLKQTEGHRIPGRFASILRTPSGR